DEIRYSDVTKPESFIVKVFVCTHILTIQTQVFLFKANYGTVVEPKLLLYFNGILIKDKP
ncbi:hypothetical protein ACNPMW_13475, partial [Acinetobacter junii]|uniref:hypothetical protein n=1 Tax=Acinetobacter junii TaxID=40215 RepID=UPI003AA92FCD